MAVIAAHFILYVTDQNESTAFYTRVLGQEPRLFVPGMTEYELRDACILGLMPVAGIRRLLGANVPEPSTAAEVYLIVTDAAAYHARALAAGATELSPLQERDWGHRAAYSRDRDGHVLAFAETLAG